MANSGFKIIENKTIDSYTANANWLTDSTFSLPEDFPDSLMTFLHLDFSLDTAAIVTIIKNGTDYVLNNGDTIVGQGFRSLGIVKGDSVQFKCSIGQTKLQFTLALEP